MSIDRAALIGAMCDLLLCNCKDCNARRLDAILPLIADAIDGQPGRYRIPYDPYWEGWDDGMGNAARVVRQLSAPDAASRSDGARQSADRSGRESGEAHSQGKARIRMSGHQRGCQVLQGINLPCNCNSPGTIDGIVGEADCKVCGLDNRNGTHRALEMVGHLSHSYQPRNQNEEAGEQKA